MTAASKLALDSCAPPAQPGVFHLRGSGATANPVILSLDDNGPTSTTAKYKDSPVVNLAGGNPWKTVGTWVGEPGAAVAMTVLRELRVILGLRNSDDQGTSFDLRAEVLKNGNVIASSADLYCLKGVTRNPNLAKVAVLAFDRAPLSFTETDVVSVRVLTRIGTDGAGHSCGGHGSATGLRVYFDSVNQDARLRGTARASMPSQCPCWDGSGAAFPGGVTLAEIWTSQVNFQCEIDQCLDESGVSLVSGAACASSNGVLFTTVAKLFGLTFPFCQAIGVKDGVQTTVEIALDDATFNLCLAEHDNFTAGGTFPNYNTFACGLPTP